jgi:hypothetical protein
MASALSPDCDLVAAWWSALSAFGGGLTACDFRPDDESTEARDENPSAFELAPATAFVADGKFLIPTVVTPTLCGECCRMYCLPPRAPGTSGAIALKC